MEPQQLLMICVLSAHGLLAHPNVQFLCQDEANKPFPKTFVVKQLLKQFRFAITSICADSAGDELLASDMLRDNELYDVSKHGPVSELPNVRFVTRGGGHNSKRIVKPLTNNS